MADRPTQAELKQRALGIVEESMAYPGMARDRLLEMKKGAIQELVAKFDENRAVLEKYYMGYTAEDLKVLLTLLPGSKHEQWHL